MLVPVLVYCTKKIWQPCIGFADEHSQEKTRGRNLAGKLPSSLRTLFISASCDQFWSQFFAHFFPGKIPRKFFSGENSAKIFFRKKVGENFREESFGKFVFPAKLLRKFRENFFPRKIPRKFFSEKR
jgi:hypothetical protein